MNRTDRILLYEQLAAFLDADLPVGEAFEFMIKNSGRRRRPEISRLKALYDEHGSIAKSLTLAKEIIPGMEAEVVTLGEEQGRLAESLKATASTCGHIEKSCESFIRVKTIAAMLILLLFLVAFSLNLLRNYGQIFLGDLYFWFGGDLNTRPNAIIYSITGLLTWGTTMTALGYLILKLYFPAALDFIIYRLWWIFKAPLRLELIVLFRYVALGMAWGMSPAASFTLAADELNNRSFRKAVSGLANRLSKDKPITNAISRLRGIGKDEKRLIGLGESLNKVREGLVSSAEVNERYFEGDLVAGAFVLCADFYLMGIVLALFQALSLLLPLYIYPT